MSKRTDMMVCREAIRRFPDSPSRQNDFIASYAGIRAKKATRRHLQKSDRNYGTGRRARQGSM